MQWMESNSCIDTAGIEVFSQLIALSFGNPNGVSEIGMLFI